MAISDEITKINNDLLSAYNAINTKGGTVPAQKNTNNLPSAILSIITGGGLPTGIEAVACGSITTTEQQISISINTGLDKVDGFIVLADEDEFLDLHPLVTGEYYTVGAFGFKSSSALFNRLSAATFNTVTTTSQLSIVGGTIEVSRYSSGRPITNGTYYWIAFKGDLV